MRKTILAAVLAVGCGQMGPGVPQCEDREVSPGMVRTVAWCGEGIAPACGPMMMQARAGGCGVAIVDAGGRAPSCNGSREVVCDGVEPTCHVVFEPSDAECEALRMRCSAIGEIECAIEVDNDRHFVGEAMAL